MTAAPNGYVFTVYTVLSAFSMGYSPATNSVASALYTRSGGKELGRLFGALAVVQTIWCVLSPVSYASGGSGMPMLWPFAARRSWARSCLG